jgi:hypothetical protein
LDWAQVAAINVPVVIVIHGVGVGAVAELRGESRDLWLLGACGGAACQKCCGYSQHGKNRKNPEKSFRFHKSPFFAAFIVLVKDVLRAWRSCLIHLTQTPARVGLALTATPRVGHYPLADHSCCGLVDCTLSNCEANVRNILFISEFHKAKSITRYCRYRWKVSFIQIR